MRAHETLCLPDLALPAGTGSVEFDTLTDRQPTPAMRLDIRSPAGRLLVRSRLASRPGLGAPTRVAFAIPVRRSDPAAEPITACITPRKSISFGGTIDRGFVGAGAPTIDGKPAGDARLAVWYGPRAGARRSLASQLPTVFERAALFRPPWVGAWTYWVLIGLVLPLALALGLFLLIRAQQLSWRRLGAGVFTLTLAISISWALVTPPFQEPDEQDHFAYVQQLAETGDTPDAGSTRPPWSSDLTLGLRSARTLAINENDNGRAPWLERDERIWAASASADPSRKNGGGPTTAATHGPVYYGVQTVAYRLAGGASIWSQLTAMRILSALMTALTVLFVLLAAREVAPSRPLFAVGAALLVALNPMFTFIGAAVNNDVGVNLAAALFLWLGVRAAQRGLTLALAAGLGCVLGVLPVIKGTSYSLYVVAALLLIALLAKTRSRAMLVGVAVTVLSLALVQIGWSNLAAGFGRTTFTTPGGGAPISGASLWGSAGLSVSYLWQIFLPPLPFMLDHYPRYLLPGYTIYIVRGWASFGWYAIEFPQIVYEVILAGIAGTMLSAAWFLRRHGDWLKARWVTILLLVATPMLVVAGVERAFATDGARPIVAEMGRYLFPAIGALGILAAGSFHAWGERWGARITTAAVVSLMVLTYASQLLTLRGFYT